MRSQRKLVLSVVLALTSLLAGVGHEATCRLACALERGNEPVPHPRTSATTLDQQAESHEHECLGCLLSSQRLFLSPTPAPREPLVAVHASSAPDVSHPLLLLYESRTSRGPPAS